MDVKIQKYLKSFFDRFYKNQHPETALRYLPIVKILKKNNLQDSKILEVGSGALGITPYLRKPIDGLDLDFSGPQSELVNQIKGSSLNLPFRKNSYDVVLCVDTLEHLEKPQREKAISEIFRVAKKMVIIVVPVGKLSEEQDRMLYSYYRKVFNSKNNFLFEHVKNGLPSTDEILIISDRVLRKLDKKAKINSLPLLSLKVREILMKTWISKNRYIYYLYLKGYLIFVPILKLANWGDCYRRLFVVEFERTAAKERKSIP